jgi:serine/threonine protein kinase
MTWASAALSTWTKNAWHIDVVEGEPATTSGTDIPRAATGDPRKRKDIEALGPPAPAPVLAATADPASDRHAQFAKQYLVSQAVELASRGPGRLIDPRFSYSFGDRVGSGTFGEAFEAIQEQTQTTVVIKLLKDDISDLGLWISEVDRLTRVSHPNVVNILDVIICDGKYGIVLAHGGKPLTSLLKGGAGPLRDWVELSRQLFLGIQYLHSQFLAHADLKPGSLAASYSSGTLALVILDLGCSVVDLVGFRRRQPGRFGSLMYGTLWYRSPELLLGYRDWGAPADNWSAGCIVAELIRMKPVFQSDDPAEVFRAQLALPISPETAVFLKGLPGWSDTWEKKTPKVGSSVRLYADVGHVAELFVSQLLHLHPGWRLSATDALGKFIPKIV